MTDDQHQPAAVAPGLSEAEITFTNAEFCRFVQEAREQRTRADKAEADLARTRAEAAALKDACIQPMMTRLDDLILPTCLLCRAIGEHADEIIHKRGCVLRGTSWTERAVAYHAALAAFQSEPQPAAPVAPSAEAKVADHVFVRRVCCERCAFWWQVESKRTYCERPYEEHAGSRPATRPPDHQAGDER